MFLPIKLGELMNGALEEKFQYAKKQVISNILDLNTPAKKAREITIKIKFVPKNDRRESVAVLTDISTKLCQIDPDVGILVLASEGEQTDLFEDSGTDKPLFPEIKPKFNEVKLEEEESKNVGVKF